MPFHSFKMDLKKTTVIFFFLIPTSIISTDSCLQPEYRGGVYSQEKAHCVQIPKDIPPSAIDIRLAENFIEKITSGCLAHVTQCKKLILTGNRIDNITQGAFSKMARLETLDLGSNKLEKITFGIFEGPKLNRLILSQNKISEIDDLSFQQQNVLTELNLEYNFIKRIEKNTFYGLSELKSLWLSVNKISDLEADSFEHLTSIKEVFMRGNLLSSLQENIFGNSHLLSLQISLNRNPLKCIDRSLCWIAQAENDGWVEFIPNGRPTCSDSRNVKKPWLEAKTQCSNAKNGM